MNTYTYTVSMDYSDYTYECVYDYVKIDTLRAIKLESKTIDEYIDENKLVRGNVGVRILRVYGELNLVYLPDIIDGFKVVVLGGYCFADKSRLIKDSDDFELTRISGEILEEIYLGENILKIESFAFYNCKNLTSLNMNHKVMAVDGDAFMNCISLRVLNVEGNVTDRTCIRQVLNQYRQGLMVSFIQNKKIVARFYYPEYTESYEEIGPAHIFALNVEGEGYRARQQFSNEILQISGYDDTFSRSEALEPVKILALMAVYRILYPVGLSKSNEEMYKDFVVRNVKEIAFEIVKKTDMEGLEFLLRKGLLTGNIKAEVLAFTVSRQWSSGAAKIIRGN